MITMEIAQFSESELKLIQQLLSHPIKGDDDKFAMALKLLQEEGKTIKLIAE